MSTTEALRMQLDALQLEYNALKVENRRLREEHPAEAKELELEQELAETRGENVRLAQTITRLEGEFEAERQGTGDEARGPVPMPRNRGAEGEAARRGSKAGRGSSDGGRMAGSSRGPRIGARIWRSDYSALRWLRELWKVAEVGRKWEEREARLVRSIEELDRIHRHSLGAQGGEECAFCKYRECTVR